MTYRQTATRARIANIVRRGMEDKGNNTHRTSYFLGNLLADQYKGEHKEQISTGFDGSTFEKYLYKFSRKGVHFGLVRTKLMNKSILQRGHMGREWTFNTRVFWILRKILAFSPTSETCLWH